MTSVNKLASASYFTKQQGNFPASVQVGEIAYEKVEDLRYGTNPHQVAAFYRPKNAGGEVIGKLKILKSGKNGLSQTNLEDISAALNIVKFFNKPACAVMKHVNPSGVAVKHECEGLESVYCKARDADARAAFGSVVAFNVEVDEATAQAVMATFVECVVAPAFSEASLREFNDFDKYKRNRHLRVIRCGDIEKLPKFTEELKNEYNSIKVLADGSLIISAPLTTAVKNVEDFVLAKAKNRTLGEVKALTEATKQQLLDLQTAWYVNLSVRSNGVVVVKNGQTLAIGTGEQDRVGAVEQAIAKYTAKYQGNNSLQGAVLASDGFFPFADALEVAVKAGIGAVACPAGSLRDAEVIHRANELGVALYHAPERIFSHH